MVDAARCMVRIAADARTATRIARAARWIRNTVHWNWRPFAATSDEGNWKESYVPTRFHDCTPLTK